MIDGGDIASDACVSQLVEWLQAIIRDLEALERMPVCEPPDGITVPAGFASPAEFIACVQRMRALFVAEAVPAQTAGPPARPNDPTARNGEWIAARAHRTRWRLLQFVDIIDERWRDPALSAAAVAAEIGVTQAWMSRMIKRQTGHGFLWHLELRRLPAAASLLLETTETVDRIAAAVGYSGTVQFNSRFKARYGVTPSAYRASGRRMSPPPRDSDHRSVTGERPTVAAVAALQPVRSARAIVSRRAA